MASFKLLVWLQTVFKGSSLADARLIMCFAVIESSARVKYSENVTCADIPSDVSDNRNSSAGEL